jgi:putative ABC transport system ATP-binding protein
MALFEEIHAEGNTVVMVTHEEDIAKYAKRTIRMIDGKMANQYVTPER